MKSVNITTPENIEVTYRLAGLGSRVVAAFIDYFIQGITYVTILLIIAKSNNPIEYLESQSSYTLAVAILIIAFINYGYFTVSEIFMNGKTLGKKMVKIKTIRKNGQPIEIKHSLIRNLFRTFVDNYMIGIVMIFFRSDNARVGDIISSTMVIEEQKEELYTKGYSFESELEKKLSEEDKHLIMAYIEEEENILIDKELLQEKLLDYFKGKYDATDPEIISLVRKELEKENTY